MIDRSRQEQIMGNVPPKEISRSQFDLSHDVKTTFNLGQLIPFMCIETLPNDIFTISHEILLRFAPLYFPIMHRVNLNVEYFYVPNRILWNQAQSGNAGSWQEFIEGSILTVPTLVMDRTAWNLIHTNYDEGGIDPVTLFEYMGARQPFDIGAVSNIEDVTLNAFPLAAYWKIYDDYYRRPQLQDTNFTTLASGDNVAVMITATAGKLAVPARRNWNMDYFTSANIEPQLGTEILVPMYDVDAKGADGSAIKGPWQVLKVSDDTTGPSQTLTSDGTHVWGTGIASSGGTDWYIDTQGPAATIRQFRLAEQMQYFLERLNYIGDRYRDIIAGFFGVDPMAGTIDYAELIGTAESVVQITDVMSVAETDVGGGTSLLGDYAGKAMGGLSTKSFSYQCKEHGHIIGIISVCPRSSYFEGISKMWTQRMDKFDYAWDEFSRIGDEPILHGELDFSYGTAPVTENDAVWGYGQRYASYKYHQDLVCGEFRNVWQDWHFGRIFTSSTDQLDDAFLQCEPRETDIFQIVDGTDPVFAHIWNQVFVARNLPKYGVPNIH